MERKDRWSTSASVPAARRWTYDVFLSFRGEDVRKSFIDHLYDKLQWRAIKTFKDDQRLEKGTSISPELHRAIKESQYAIVVFSPNYASSTWCLDELAVIFRCMAHRSILPIFYNVDPSDVRHQRGTFAEAFRKHEEDTKINKGRLDRWRCYLRTVSNLVGWPSSDRFEAELIKEVVEVVWKKVHPTHTLSDSTENLVGLDSRLNVIGSLAFTINSACFTGIWGMGGIGKTTLARLYYERISHHFEVSCFIANIRERSSKFGLAHLQNQLLSLILEEKTTQVWDVYSGSTMTKNLLSNRKVLLILDDVDKLNQLEILAGKVDWFGPGSRIIVTTRDERLLIEHGIVKRYEVLGLNDDQALHLFSLKAFKTDHPEEDYVELSKCFVNYARGHPLALLVLGSSLYKRESDAWTSALDKLKKAPNAEIFENLKISYDGLDKIEKRVFLDVACFHIGNDKERVTEILENCGLSGRIVIDVLIEKSLLSILDGYVMMHDLTQEMGWEIVRREEPGSRLWLRKDIFDVFMNNTGTEAIEGIVLRLPELEQVQWNPESFTKISKLKFLQLHNLNLSVGPEYLSNALRVLDWSWYPSKSLPPTFQPDELSELSLHHSKIDWLWSGIKYMSCLKYIDLSYSQKLTATPDFRGVQNLECLVLESCTNLDEIHLSLAVLKRLKVLNFRNCNGIESLPSVLEMESLEVFILSGCSKLKMIPEFGGNTKNLRILSLDGTAIQEIPSSIDHLIGLISLDLKDCKSLLCLHTAICSLKSLKNLSVSGCSKLDTIPENWEEMECLEELDLSGTAIREPPSSLFRMKSLKVLSLCGCKGPPPKSWHLLLQFSFFSAKNPDPMGLVLTSSDYLFSLSKLDLSDCNLLQGQGAIPDDIGCLSSLEDLNLRGNDFVSLPASIRWLDNLKFLNLESCKSLQELPDLPSNEELTVTTDDCTCLNLLPHPTNISRLRWFFLRAINCYRLIGNEAKNNMIFLMLHRFLQGTPPLVVHSFNIVAPGSEMPEWFDNQRVGDSLVVEVPHRGDIHPTKRRLKGFALCAVFGPQNPAALELDCECHACGIKCLSIVDGSMNTSLLVNGVYYHKAGKVQSDHLWLLYLSFKRHDANNYWKGIFDGIEFSFKTFCSGTETNKCLKLKKCGVRMVYEQDAEDLNSPNNSISLYEPMDDPHCALPKSADVQSALNMKQTTEHFDGAGSSGSSSVSAKESLTKSLKYD